MFGCEHGARYVFNSWTGGYLAQDYLLQNAHSQDKTPWNDFAKNPDGHMTFFDMYPMADGRWFKYTPAFREKRIDLDTHIPYSYPPPMVWLGSIQVYPELLFSHISKLVPNDLAGTLLTALYNQVLICPYIQMFYFSYIQATYLTIHSDIILPHVSRHVKVPDVRV